MLISYNWLQNYFEEKLPSPEEIKEKLTFHSFEVEDIEELKRNKEKDYIFNISILPDRAHDCLSHLGVAKEIALVFNIKLFYQNGFEKILKSPDLGAELPSGSSAPKWANSTNLQIEVNSDKCIRYMGRIVKGIEIKESPIWLKESLESIGQKSINILVDIANFLMFDLGQPIHIFDLDKLESEKIIVREGKRNEKIITLDKNEINLDDTILVIADEKHPLAIAGIKGGDRAEVKEGTKNIIIEVADFNSTSTRKTARKLNILTDAVKRYENKIHPELCEITMQAISKLILNLIGGELEKTIDNFKEKDKYSKNKKISISLNYINKYLGSTFKKEEVEEVFEKLGFKYINNNDTFEVVIPLLRLDLELPCNLVEEVGRVLGYDKLKSELPEILKDNKKIDDTLSKILSARDYMLKEGYSEVLNYTFVDKGNVEVLASASDKNFLRNNLKDGLEISLKLNTLNAPLLKEIRIKIFEIGTVFLKDKEEVHIAWNEKKQIKEMELGKFIKEKKISITFFSGSLSESVDSALTFDPSVCERPEKESARDKKILNPFSKQKQLSSRTLSKFKMWSLYPFIVRDIALWVPENIASEEVLKVIKNEINELVVIGPYLFDEFEKDDRISYAFRLVFQSYDRTLTIEEVNNLIEKITNKLKENKDWMLR